MGQRWTKRLRRVTSSLLAIALVTAGLYLPAASAEASDSATGISVTLGETPVINGISPRAGDNPAGLRTGMLDGITYWETNKAEDGPQTVYFYMDADDLFLHENTGYNVSVTMEYFDEGNGSAVLQYDSESNAFKDAPLFTYTDTHTWKTHTFELSDAWFGNRTNGADFRLGIEGGGVSAAANRDLKVASVSISKTLKPLPSDEAGIILGDTPVPQGITARGGDYEPGVLTGTLAGRGYWSTNRSAPDGGTLYLYMNVADDYLYDNTDQDVYLTVDYYDEGSGSMVLQYDAVSAPFKDATLFNYTDTKQWLSHTFKLADAKFSDRTNGSDFRIGISGAGATDNNPDLKVARVTVKKSPRITAPSQTGIVQTVYGTEDIVIANINVKDYGAKGDGTTDDTAAVQNALHAASVQGGGVVFAPEGTYRLNGHLVIPTGVTLRGDRPDPAAGDYTVRGTVLAAYEGRGEENGTSLIRMEPVSGVTHLSVWYPEQTLDTPAAYPWTFEQLSGDSATISNVTLVNSYNGIKIGPVWNELHYIRDVYGTALKTGIFLDFTTDIGRLERVTLAPEIWSGSGLPGAAEQQALFDYMTSHAEGVVMGRSDWEYMSDLSISGFKTGLRVTTRTDSLETANAQLYRVRIKDCNVALKIEGVNDYGLLVSDSSFEAGAGEAPVAIQATQGFHSIAQFNTVTVGGNPLNAVVNDGSGVLSFENSSFTAWNGEAGGYAIAANGGSLLLGQSTFARPGRHVLLGSAARTVNAINSGYDGQLEIADQSEAAEVNVHQDEAYTLEVLPEGIVTDRAAAPKPATNLLFDVTASPYNADWSGLLDVSAAVQQALDDAGAAGGGTVYLPAGTYRIDTRLTVPPGVELRGSWDVPHHTIGGGTVIFTNYGEGKPEEEALITLEASAGIRGLSVYYDKQDWSNIKPYAWTVRGKGHGVYAIDATLVNPYQGIDFGSYDTSGHYIDYVAGSPLKEGIFVGGGSSGGFVRNVQFNPHYYGRSTYPNHPDTDAAFQQLWDYQKDNLDAFRIADVSGETVFNTFVYGSQYGIHFAAQYGRGPQAVVVGHGTDGSKKGAVLDSAAPEGLTLINTELVSLSSSDKVYVTVGEDFNSKATLFNSSMWGDTTRSFDIHGGKINIQQANVTTVGERGLGALGGDIALYDSYFQQARTTHVYADPAVGRLILTNNLYNGGLQLDNRAPSRVTGTDLVPVSLQLAVTPFDEAGGQPNAVLTLSNLSLPQPLKGKLELLEPAVYQSVMQPVRFEGVEPGSSIDIPLPFLASDSLKFKITLDHGEAYVTSVKLGQSFAAFSADGAGNTAAPAVTVSDAGHYFSLGGQWKGTGDLSAEARLRWDEDRLYVTVAVHDDVHAQSWTGGDIWQGDSLQLGIDLSRQEGSASPDVSELGFALNGQGTVSAWRWRAPQGLNTGVLPGVQADISRNEVEGVTLYELAIPFAQLHGPGTAFTPEDAIGFTLLLNENDGAGRAGFIEYNQGIGTSKDATLYGDLYLLQGSFAEALAASAETAVAAAEAAASVTAVDAAANFVALLPEGNVKDGLKNRLALLDPGTTPPTPTPTPTPTLTPTPTPTSTPTPSATAAPTPPPASQAPASAASPSASPPAVPVITVSGDGTAMITAEAVPGSGPQTAGVTLSAELLEKAFGQTAETGGVRKIAVQITGSPGARGYGLQLPSAFLGGAGPDRVIELITPTGTLTLPGNMLDAATLAAAGSNVTVTIREADREGWGAELQRQSSGRPAVNIVLTSGNRKLDWRSSNAPVTVSLPYQLSAGEEHEDLAVRYIADNGEAAAVASGHYNPLTGRITFRISHFSEYAVVSAAPAFGDLNLAPWAKQAIRALAAKGIIRGQSAVSFNPKAPITRADLVMLLSAVLELKPEPAASPGNAYADVRPDAYYAQAVSGFRALGIAGGTGGNRFEPEKPVSRQDAAVLVQRALALKPGTSKLEAAPEQLYRFADAQAVSGYARDSISQLLQAKLLQGDRGRLNPQLGLTRAEAAVLIYNLYNYIYGI
ncbi:glycosyl hydrolase family 28-related protein [Paenibacillus borealis]|uniref:S-layer protein n=1 Tax=Paenibacillus borealis TaxID=160799 RepID=A0A089LNC3_PAEBO|nr:glycosyl hydrolase family 28-related protein [Paenibacillus borealis]AIQ60673.1 S-layer protein [Paenibacillus borealis]